MRNRVEAVGWRNSRFRRHPKPLRSVDTETHDPAQALRETAAERKWPNPVRVLLGILAAPLFLAKA